MLSISRTNVRLRVPGPASFLPPALMPTRVASSLLSGHPR